MAYSNAAQKADSFFLDKGATRIGGFKTRSLKINGGTVDVTTSDDTSRYRQLLAATGVKSLSFSGSGLVKDNAAGQAVVTDALAQTTDTYTVTVPGLGTFVGAWQITEFTVAGENQNEVTYDITLESAGDIVFTAEG